VSSEQVTPVSFWEMRSGSERLGGRRQSAGSSGNSNGNSNGNSSDNSIKCRGEVPSPGAAGGRGQILKCSVLTPVRTAFSTVPLLRSYSHSVRPLVSCCLRFFGRSFCSKLFGGAYHEGDEELKANFLKYALRMTK
jgi:hypothetical protein